MSAFKLRMASWLPEAKTHPKADFFAGLTLWALLVPQSIAYAKLAGATTPLAGLYCLIFVLPVYALFASSNRLVPSPTTAVSATFAGFLAAMVSPPEAAFQALVIGTALAYFVFWFFKLGFLTNFISIPVSIGYLSGLSIIVIIKQIPDLFGFAPAQGSVLAQLLGIFANLPQTNLATLIFSLVILILMIGLPKLSRNLPAGLIAVALSMFAGWLLQLESAHGVSMVGALSRGLPGFHLFDIKAADFAVIIPAAIGMVILATGEASVTAQSLGAKHNELVDMNQQFFAFGMGNLAGGMMGSMLGTGASSASMVSENAGAKTLMASIWAALAALLTLLFLSGLFAYLPNAFLAALVITAVWHMLNFSGIWAIGQYRKGEMFIAITAQFSVIVFGILNGLLISMLINVLYFAYRTSAVRIEPYGFSSKDPHIMVPLGSRHAQKLPKSTLALGMRDGQMFYASARSALNGAIELMKKTPKAKTIVISFARVSALDYTSYDQLKKFLQEVEKLGKKLIITDVRNDDLFDQLKSHDFQSPCVEIYESYDLSQLN